MALVTDLLDQLQRMRAERALWEQHWYDIARYVLPDAERFDKLFSIPERSAAINTVVASAVLCRVGIIYWIAVSI